MLPMFLFASCALDIVENDASRKVGRHPVVDGRDNGWIREVPEYREVTNMSVRPLSLVEEEEKGKVSREEAEKVDRDFKYDPRTLQVPESEWMDFWLNVIFIPFCQVLHNLIAG